MSVIDVANGFRGSKGKTTLSVRDTQELQEIVNMTGRTIDIDRMRSGGCEVNCEDLCRVIFGEDDDEDQIVPDPRLLNNQASDIVAKISLTPSGKPPRRQRRRTDLAGTPPLSHRRGVIMTPDPNVPGAPGSGGTFSEHPGSAQPGGDGNPIGARGGRNSLVEQLPGLEIDPSGRSFGTVDPRELHPQSHPETPAEASSEVAEDSPPKSLPSDSSGRLPERSPNPAQHSHHDPRDTGGSSANPAPQSKSQVPKTKK